jgi:hypothetical protein
VFGAWILEFRFPGEGFSRSFACLVGRIIASCFKGAVSLVYSPTRRANSKMILTEGNKGNKVFRPKAPSLSSFPSVSPYFESL